MQEASQAIVLPFMNKAGRVFGGASTLQVIDLRRELGEHYGLQNLQLAEGCAYGLAMVVRFALGLAAIDGRVCALVGNSFASQVVLAAIRHLVNGGSASVVVLVEDICCPDVAKQLATLSKMGVEIAPLNEIFAEIEPFLGSCHNVLYGLFETQYAQSNLSFGLLDKLNDLAIPVHTVGAPTGVDLDTGQVSPSALFASSTLSLGVPYIGLAAAPENIGRHYLADCSYTSSMYQKLPGDFLGLFSEQPVIQIFSAQKKNGA